MTILWRSFIIALAILLHLLSLRMAHADEAVSFRSGFMNDLTPGWSCPSMEQEAQTVIRLEERMAQVGEQ